MFYVKNPPGYARKFLSDYYSPRKLILSQYVEFSSCSQTYGMAYFQHVSRLSDTTITLMLEQYFHQEISYGTAGAYSDKSRYDETMVDDEFADASGTGTVEIDAG
jgi:hypothetical protein